MPNPNDVLLSVLVPRPALGNIEVGSGHARTGLSPACYGLSSALRFNAYRFAFARGFSVVAPRLIVFAFCRGFASASIVLHNFICIN